VGGRKVPDNFIPHNSRVSLLVFMAPYQIAKKPEKWGKNAAWFMAVGL